MINIENLQLVYQVVSVASQKLSMKLKVANELIEAQISV